jgi:hypothetical protein
MRFKRRPRTPYLITDRKRAAALRWQQRQRDAVPLLAELVEEQQPSIDHVMHERVRLWTSTEQSDRDWRARQWRHARRLLDAHEPSDPTYLLGTINRFATGRLIIVDGMIQPARVTIPVAEAADIEAKPKPFTPRWLSRLN